MGRWTVQIVWYLSPAHVLLLKIYFTSYKIDLLCILWNCKLGEWIMNNEHYLEKGFVFCLKDFMCPLSKLFPGKIVAVLKKWHKIFNLCNKKISKVAQDNGSFTTLTLSYWNRELILVKYSWSWNLKHKKSCILFRFRTLAFRQVEQ